MCVVFQMSNLISIHNSKSSTCTSKGHLVHKDKMLQYLFEFYCWKENNLAVYCLNKQVCAVLFVSFKVVLWLKKKKLLLFFFFDFETMFTKHSQAKF